MALPDPELDLLRELLQEDPSADCFPVVGAELLERGLFAEATDVLKAGLDATTVQGTQRQEYKTLLARAACGAGRFDDALVALRGLNTTPQAQPERARLYFLALEGTGHLERALELGRVYLELHPDDQGVRDATLRIEAPPPDPSTAGHDPFDTVARAEGYALNERVDRAVRVFRRILFAQPNNIAVAGRLRELETRPHDPFVDDLSEDLTASEARMAPLNMPAPSQSARSQPTSIRAMALSEDFEQDFDDDEATLPMQVSSPFGVTDEPAPMRDLPGRSELEAALSQESGDLHPDAADDGSMAAVPPDSTEPKSARREGSKKPARRRRSLLRR